MGFSVARKTTMLSTLPATIYVQGHSGDPGSAGTNNVLAGNARIPVPLAAAANGARAPQPGTYELDVQAGQTIGWVSYWDAATAGNFEGSDALDAAETFAGNGKYRLTTQNLTITG